MQVDVGAFVDVRCVAVSIRDDAITVRIPGVAALHQIAIAPHLIQQVAIRSHAEIAADPVCNSYVEHLPHNRERRARND